MAFVGSTGFNTPTGAAEINQKLISLGFGEHLKTMWGFPSFPSFPSFPGFPSFVRYSDEDFFPRTPHLDLSKNRYKYAQRQSIFASSRPRFIFRSSTTAMPFGILNPCNSVEHVRGISLLLQVDSLFEAEETSGLERGTGKHARTILIPQPSLDPNDPLRWPVWQRDLIFLLYLYCTILCAGGSVITTMNGPKEQVS